MSNQSESDQNGSEARLETEVARRTEELQAALDQKTALLQELDHRVKNNLQVIASLVLLKSRRLEDPSARRVLTEMAGRVNALSTAHRLLQSEGGPSRFDLRDLVTDLANDLMVPFNPANIELALDLDAVDVSAERAAPLALIVNELVSNALKHAFPGGRGRLFIALKAEDGFRIVVEDNGVGLPNHASPEEGLGKTLVAMLGRQLRAAIAWEDANPGTRIVIAVPPAVAEARA